MKLCVSNAAPVSSTVAIVNCASVSPFRKRDSLRDSPAPREPIARR